MNNQWYLVGLYTELKFESDGHHFYKSSHYFNGFYRVLNNPVLLLDLSKNNPQSSSNPEYLISCLLLEDNSFSFNFTIRSFNRDLRDNPKAKT